MEGDPIIYVEMNNGESYPIRNGIYENLIPGFTTQTGMEFYDLKEKKRGIFIGTSPELEDYIIIHFSYYLEKQLIKTGCHIVRINYYKNLFWAPHIIHKSLHNHGVIIRSPPEKDTQERKRKKQKIYE